MHILQSFVASVGIFLAGIFGHATPAQTQPAAVATSPIVDATPTSLLDIENATSTGSTTSTQYITQPVIERIIEKVSGGVSQTSLDAQLAALASALRLEISGSHPSTIISAPSVYTTPGNTIPSTLTSDNVTDADIPNTITASNYLPLSGGAVTGALSVSENVGIATTAPAYTLDVAGVARSKSFITNSLTLSSNNASIFNSFVGYKGYTNFSGGVSTGGSDTNPQDVRISSDGNLVNIGSIQAGETSLTKAGTFVARVNYTAGTGTYGVAIGDLNGDGKRDIAAVNQTVDTLSIFINNGDGTFASKVDYSTGATPRSVAIGDLNGDGKVDLALGYSGTLIVSVYINNGDGTFATRTDYTSNGGVGVALGDVDGDAKPDMVVTGGTAVSVFINNNNGTFASKVDYTAGASGTYGVAVGDLNGDGKADVTATNISDNTVSVFLNNGNGTFATKVDYATGATPRFVAISDLNGDGKNDMAVDNWTDSTVSVYLNNGSGAFASQVTYSTGSNSWPHHVAAADLNGDGKPDLVTANHVTSNVSVLINNGNGTFASAAQYATGGNSRFVAIGDLNGDGKNDLVTANNSSNNIGVLMNATSTMFYAQASTGRISIGTSTPYAGLTVWGSNTSASTKALEIANSASTTILSVTNDGNASLSGTLTQGSDSRLKGNVTKLASSTLVALLRLSPVSYVRIDQEDSKTQYGFIAQEVAEIFPDLVSTSSETVLTPGGTRTLNYIGFIAPIVSAIQELAGTIAGFTENFVSAHITVTTGDFKKINTDELCVDGTCITGDQFRALLNSNGQTATPALLNPLPNQTESDSATTTEQSSAEDAPVDTEATSTDQTTPSL